MSTSFADEKGRTWNLSITPWEMKAVRARTGVDLGKLLNDDLKPFRELVSNPATFVDVLFVLCEEQARAAGVSDEDFGRAMYGDAVDRAGLAFEEAFLLFCPSRTRKILGKLLTAARAAAERAGAEFEARVEAADLDAIFTATASNSPESSASIPPG